MLHRACTRLTLCAELIAELQKHVLYEGLASQRDAIGEVPDPAVQERAHRQITAGLENTLDLFGGESVSSL
jgi:hypothetical protein